MIDNGSELISKALNGLMFGKRAFIAFSLAIVYIAQFSKLAYQVCKLNSLLIENDCIITRKVNFRRMYAV